MKFKRKDLIHMVYEDSDKLSVVEDKIQSHSRWSVGHGVVFKDNETGKYYLSAYSVGATEQQDESAYEYSPDEVDCDEVVQKEITVKQWVAK